jgi:hypothetical protein
MEETNMKDWLVSYTGTKLEPNDEKVTVEMIVELMAKEFPEFLLVVAEENFIRGYEQALDDVNDMRKKYGSGETIHKNLSSNNP